MSFTRSNTGRLTLTVSSNSTKHMKENITPLAKFSVDRTRSATNRAYVASSSKSQRLHQLAAKR